MCVCVFFKLTLVSDSFQICRLPDDPYFHTSGFPYFRVSSFPLYVRTLFDLALKSQFSDPQ